MRPDFDTQEHHDHEHDHPDHPGWPAGRGPRGRRRWQGPPEGFGGPGMGGPPWRRG